MQGHMGTPQAGPQAEDERREATAMPFLEFPEGRQGNSRGLASLDNLGALGYRYGPWFWAPALDDAGRRELPSSPRVTWAERGSLGA